MILAERMNTRQTDQFEQFGEKMSDGRMTEASNGKVYRLREAILLSKRLGRPLTENEMKQFEVDK